MANSPDSANMIETPRSMLTEVTATDAPFILELMNSKGWLEYIGDRKIDSLSDAQTYIQNSFVNSYEKRGFGMYKVSLRNSFLPIGLCGLVTRPELDKIEIGFALLPEHSGKGYALEAGKATIQYAQQVLDIQEIYAITLPHNTSSKNLLSKLGLVLEKGIKLRGEDLLLYKYA